MSKLIKSATISFAGDRSVGLPNVSFDLTGGDFIFDPSCFGCEEAESVERFRSALQTFAENNLGGDKAFVFLHGWDVEPIEPQESAELLKEIREVLAVALAWPNSRKIRQKIDAAINKAEGK